MAAGYMKLSAKDLGLVDNDDETLDVLDLPQLYTKPSAKALLSTLEDISSEPPSWEATPRSGTPRSGTPRSPLSGISTPLRGKPKVKSEGLPRYLTNIISSPLVWIESDEDKEMIWEAASQRLSERSGRTAMGAITRTFEIPVSVQNENDPQPKGQDIPSIESGSGSEVVEIRLHEPALTADNLGLKTWASSYLLAKRMATLQSTLPAPMSSGSRILELGAGTGLVGLAAAAVLRAHVILTDLPAIVPNLERNAQDNEAEVAARGGRVEVGTLDWSEPAAFGLSGDGALRPGPNTFPLILVADPIYSSEHPALLVGAIQHHLARTGSARVVVELPLRDAFSAERADFRTRMAGAGLDVLEEGEEVGFDDWSSGADENDLTEVRCWWNVWAWR